MRAGVPFRRILSAGEPDEALRYHRIHLGNDRILDARRMHGDQYRVTLRMPTAEERERAELRLRFGR